MKSILKSIAGVWAFVFVLPILLWWWLMRLAMGRNAACEAVTQGVAGLPGRIGEYLRRAVLRRVLARVSPDVVVAFGTIVSKPTAELAAGVYVGAYCVLGDVRIGEDTLLADHISIPSGARQHGIDRTDVPMRQQPGEFRTVHVGRDCWIGSGAVVLADVGDHAIVAAGSVVTRPVPAWTIVAGNPASEVGRREPPDDAAAGDATAESPETNASAEPTETADPIQPTDRTDPIDPQAS